MRAFRILRAPLGVFAILGNHDGGRWARFPPDWMASIVRDAGIRLLENDAVRLDFRGRTFNLIGLRDYWSGAYDPAPVFAAVDPALFTIVLSHNPDTFASLLSHRCDLILSGHTHGGQVRIPFVGAPLVPIHDRRFVEGHVRVSDRSIYVSRGLGVIRQVRFNCPPEITHLEIA